MQLTATILLPLLFLIVDQRTGLSVGIGCVIAFLATALQVPRFTRPYQAQYPEALLAGLLLSELSKLILVATLFALAFISLAWIRPLQTFMGFIVVYLTPYIGMLLCQFRASK